MDLNASDYISSRVDVQIKWYDDKSGANQFWFKCCRIVEIASAALIPFLSAISSTNAILPYLIALLGIIIAITAAVSALFKFQENWIQYRTSAEQLKHEKYLFLTQAGPYQSTSFPTFVERIESLISRENSLWAQQTKKQTKTGSAD